MLCLQPHCPLHKVAGIDSATPGVVGELHNAGLLLREHDTQSHIVVQGSVILAEAETVMDGIKLLLNFKGYCPATIVGLLWQRSAWAWQPRRKH